jgi:AcrR family transcriptional regulator
MASRNYRLGRRQAAADRTRAAILAAARDLLTAGGPALSAAAVAKRAGVSRITVYNRFGSKAGLLRELAETARGAGTSRSDQQAEEPRERLRQRIAASCSMWSADPALFRRLDAIGNLDMSTSGEDRMLAEELAAADQLRPGCSLKEAEDVIGALTSFDVFDRLHKDGRRSTAAVSDILMRLAATLLSSESASPGWAGFPRR